MLESSKCLDANGQFLHRGTGFLITGQFVQGPMRIELASENRTYVTLSRWTQIGDRHQIKYEEALR